MANDTSKWIDGSDDVDSHEHKPALSIRSSYQRWAIGRGTLVVSVMRGRPIGMWSSKTRKRVGVMGMLFLAIAVVIVLFRIHGKIDRCFGQRDIGTDDPRVSSSSCSYVE